MLLFNNKISWMKKMAFAVADSKGYPGNRKKDFLLQLFYELYKFIEIHSSLAKHYR